jgi:peptidoglycan/xylan/chitin deacetylase (PgdA/CDA1 family)
MFQIYAYTATNDVFRMNFSVTSSSWLANQWSMIWGDPYFNPNSWVVFAGNPSWSNITKIKIVLTTVAGQISDVSFDLLSFGSIRKPAVLLAFDDNFDTQFSIAYPLIKAKNMVASIFCVSSYIDGVNKLTTANLLELYNKGWDIANHCKTHTDLTTLNLSQQEGQFTDCRDVLNALGLTRASLHIAYPNGLYNADTLTAMQNIAAKTGRTITGTVYSWYERGYYNLGYPHKINCKNIATTTTLAQAKGYIDSALVFNAPIVLLFHKLDNTTPAVDTWITSDFVALLDYIESLGIQTLTIDEYYRLDSGSITVHHK